jgi:hypothetical protein
VKNFRVVRQRLAFLLNDVVSILEMTYVVDFILATTYVITHIIYINDDFSCW